MGVSCPISELRAIIKNETMIINQEKSYSENDKKIKPLRVIECHLSAINTQIKKDADFFNLKKLDYYNNKIVKNSNYDDEKLKKLLFNAWSTEFALRTAGSNQDLDFKKFSLHWCFPQAYYSVFLTTTAYYLIKNITLGHNHNGLLKEFAQQIKRDWYPNSMSFFCSGTYNNYDYTNICSCVSKNPLSYSKYDENTSDMQVAQFLKSTRDILIEKKRKEKQSQKHAILTKNGKTKKSYNKQDWVEVSKNQWDTTILDLLYRLRIKSNYEEIDTFIEADYDVSNIIEQLKEIVYNMNFVSECFISKAIGFEKYKLIVESFPAKAENSQIVQRLNEPIAQNK